MARPVNLYKGTIQYAQEICINPDSVTQLKKGLSVVLAPTFGADADTIGQTLGIDRSTVFRYRDELSKIANGLKEKDTAKWGG